MSDLKKNDFFATLVKNPNVTLKDLQDNNITADNSALLSADEYKKLDQVQEVFKGDDGKFDEKKFNNAYNNAKTLYTNYAQDEWIADVAKNMTYGSDEWFAPSNANFRQQNPVILIDTKPSDVSQGIKFITDTVAGAPANLSIRELAQREKIVDYETGEELDFSPNDKAGLFSAFELPTAVLATWDEDGSHEENGITVLHKAGDIKYNKNGKPYYETLGDREIYGKDVLRHSDILTVDGSKWNKFDFLDSDDVDKPFLKTAFNLVAHVAPMFVPVVGEVYGFVGAADGLMRVLPTLGKAINGFLGGDGNGLDQALNKWESYAARWDPTQSDKARQTVVTWEGLGSMISAVSGQLFQQRAVSTIPVLLGKLKRSTDYEKIANTSKKLAFAYMAATSSQDTYGDFKAAGATDQMAGLATIGSVLALYNLMKIDYFRDNLLKGTFMDESEVGAALSGAAQKTAERFGTVAKEIGNAATAKSAAKFTDSVARFYHKTLLNGLKQDGFRGLVNRGFSEGSEEVMEEALADLIKGTTEAFNALGINVTDPNKTLDFGWSVKDGLQRYLTSFAGGFIGGMVFAGQNRYEKWLRNVQNNITELPVNDQQKLVYYLATGKRGEIDHYLNKWHEKGLLGSKNLIVDGSMQMTAEGTEQFIPDSKGINQNDAVYYSIKNTLDALENAISGEIGDVRSYLTAEGIQQLQTLGYSPVDAFNENSKLLPASAIAALGDYSSFENDIIDNLTEIISTKNQLEARVKELNSGKKAATEDEKKASTDSIKDDETVKTLQEKLKKLREEKELLFSGAKNKYYASQALFAANQEKQRPFVEADKETYAKLVKGMSYSALSDEAKAEVDEQYKEDSKNIRKKVYKAHDLYLDLQVKYAPIIQQSEESLKRKFKEGEKSVKPILAFSEYLDVREELEKINGELSELNNIPEEDLTEEQIEKKESLENKKQAAQTRMRFMLRNPKLLMVTPTKETNIDVFTGATDENQKIEILDDKAQRLKVAQTSTIAPDTSAEILNMLRSEYQANVAAGDFRFDDNELLTLYRGLVASYEGMGGAKERLSSYRADARVDIESGGLGYGDEETIYDINFGDERWMDVPFYETELTDTIDQIVKNLGIDNAVAKRSYDHLLEILSQHTNLLDPKMEKYLKDFLSYVIPTIDGVSIMDIMTEFDGYRSQLPKSPLFQILAQMGTDVKDLNLLQLIEQESMHLSTSPIAEDYLIQNSQIKNSLKIESLKKSLNVVRAVLRSAADGTNETINAFKVKEDDKSIPALAVMSKEAYSVLNDHIENVLNKIKFLQKLALANENRNLRKHKDTAINMRPKWLKAILGLNLPLKDTEGNDITVQQLWDDTTDNASLEPTEDNFAEWERKVINFEDALYDKLHDLPNIANIIVDSVNKKELYRSGITTIGEKDDIEISPKDLVYHLASLVSVPSSKVVTAWSSAVTAYNEEVKAWNQVNKGHRKKLISVYGQEYIGRQLIAQALNPELFDTILDAVEDNADIDEKYEGNNNEHYRRYLKNRTRLYHMSTVLGGAGVGKTIGIANIALRSLTGGRDDVHTIFLAKEQEQADKVARSAGSVNNAYTVETFFEKVFGIKNPTYTFEGSESASRADEVTEHWRLDNLGTYDPNNAILPKSGITIIAIDEVETLNEPQLKRLSQFAKSHNIFLVGIGDLKQPGEDIKGVQLDSKEKIATSGLEDCAFVSSPILTTTMRGETIAQSENAALLGHALDSVLAEQYKNPALTLQEADGLVAKNLEKTTLYYFKDPNTNELAGTMGVSTQEGFEEQIKQISQLNGTVAIITDDTSGKYTRYVQDGKVSLVDYSKRAGGEWDYVLVDVDFAKTTRDSKYLLTKDFYTLTQRARRGVVIKTSDATKLFNFISDPLKAQNIAVTDEQLDEYAKWRAKSWEGLPSDINALSEYLENSSLFTHETTPEPETPVTPPPSGKPEPENPETEPETEPENPEPEPEPEPEPKGPVTPPSNNSGGGAVNPEETPSGSNAGSKPEISTTPIVETSSESEFGSPGIEKFFTGDPDFKGSLNTLKSVLAWVFSECDMKDLYKAPGVKVLEDYLKEPCIAKMRKAVKAKYGKDGVTIFDDIINHPRGYRTQEEIEAINTALANLKPLSISPKNYGKPEKKTPATKKRLAKSGCDLTDYYDVLKNDDYIASTINTTQPSDLDSYQTLPYDIKNFGKVRKGYKRIADYILTGGWQPSYWRGMATIMDCADIRDDGFSSGSMKLWIVHHPGGKRMLVARHYNADGSKHFDTPVLLINSNGSVGEYTGSIQLVRKLHFDVQKDKSGKVIRKSIAQMQEEYPELRYAPYIGVIKDKSDIDMSTLDEDSQKYIENNLGKAMVAATCNEAVYDKLFDQGYVYQVNGTSEEPGKTVQNYRNVAMSAFQCVASDEQFIEVLRRAEPYVFTKREAWRDATNHKYKTWKSTRKSDKTESNETCDSAVLEQIQLLTDDKNKTRQLLPDKRAGMLLTALMEASDSVSTMLRGFLSTIKSKGKTTTIHTLRVGNVEIGIVDDKYRVGQVVDGKFKPTSGKGISVKAPQALLKLVRSVSGEQYPSIHFKLYDSTVDPHGRGRTFIREFSNNFELAMAISAIGKEDPVEKLKKARESINMPHGIYMDDHARSTTATPSSFYGILETGNRTYTTEYTVVHYPVYRLDIDGMGEVEEPIKPSKKAKKEPSKKGSEEESSNISTNTNTNTNNKQSFDDFLREAKIGLYRKVHSVEEANVALAENAVDWQYQYIEETDDGYVLRTHDSTNLIPWLEDKMDDFSILSTEQKNEVATGVLNLGEKSFYLSPVNKYIVMRAIKGYTFVKAEDALKKAVVEVSENNVVPFAYISKSLTKENYDTEYILSQMQSDNREKNLEIAKKIAKFEEILTDINNCL